MSQACIIALKLYYAFHRIQQPLFLKTEGQLSIRILEL